MPRKNNEEGIKNLSEGQSNVLIAKLIDMMSENESLTNLVGYTKDYYLKTTGKVILNPYEKVYQAKRLWLSNINLPSLEDYKRDKFIKMEQLSDKVATKSRKDIVDQSKAIVEISKYQDNIIGLNKDINNDVNISIIIDKEKVLTSLDIDE